ncbi:Quinolinate phosphoribosyl transferase [Melampsora americana]|nr:Quinolinate phosphoribosyl transferase [Melampsora americana]
MTIIEKNYFTFSELKPTTFKMTTTTANQTSIPLSILDTDLYKLTMQSVIHSEFPNKKVSYIFINRSNDERRLISKDCFEEIKFKINQLENVKLTLEERDYLRRTCPYFKTSYLDYLFQFKFKPKDHIQIRLIHQDKSSEDGSLGELEIKIHGIWLETILYEVPILSIISESYFKFNPHPWSLQSQSIRSKHKSIQLLKSGCRFIEFGTRRRRSYETQRLVIQGLLEGLSDLNSQSDHQGALIGTSNVHFAMKFNLKPIGTIAHEFVMGIAAIKGYHPQSNLMALELWEKSFENQSNLLVAITDTFTTHEFFKELASDPDRVKRWSGLRQDSGDPKDFVLSAKALWNQIGIDPKSKLIVFSDGLDVEKCIELHQFCEEEGVNESYGIGTHLTNDFDELDQDGQIIGPSKALNIVIKLESIDDLPCVKLSDGMFWPRNP